MVRRFSRRMLKSRILQKVKRMRFRQAKANKRATKDSALRRLELQKKYDWLRRIGKLPEETQSARGNSPFKQKK